MAVSILKNKNVSKKLTSRDVPYSELSEVNKRLLNHLRHNQVSHKASEIAVTGTYVNIPGTPTSLEDTLKSIETVLSAYMAPTPINPALSVPEETIEGTPADLILTHTNALGIKHDAQDIRVEQNLNTLGSPPDVESALCNIDSFINTAVVGLPSLFLIASSIDNLFVYLSPKTLTPKFESQADILKNQWVTQNSLATATAAGAGGGSREYAIIAGGYTGAPDETDRVELFNNTLWSAGPVLTAKREGSAGIGTQRSFFCCGGFRSGTGRLGDTIGYNGSAWAAGAAIFTTRSNLTGVGNRSAALIFGGLVGAPPLANVDYYNGSTWSNVAPLGTACWDPGGAGTALSALCCGGYNGAAAITIVEKWNGAAWANVAPLLVANSYLGCTGTANDALIMGGQNIAVLNRTDSYNGYSWVSVGTEIVGRSFQNESGCGSSGAALSFNGDTGGGTCSVVTEKWYGSTPRVIIDYTAFEEVSTDFTSSDDIQYGEWWKSGSATISAPIRAQFVSNLVCSKDDLIDLKNDFKHQIYNEGIWSAAASLNTARFGHGGGGTQGSAFVCAGYGVFPAFINSTEKFDGSVWSNSGNTIFTGYACGGVGIANAALHFGGYNGFWLTDSERFNGSIWASTPSLNNNVSLSSGAGHQNAAIYIGAYAGGPALNIAEIFNGTVWSNIGVAPPAIDARATTGTIAAAIAVGGNQGGPIVATTTLWNGAAFSASQDSLIALRDAAAVGPSNNAMMFGGHLDNPAHASFLTLSQQFNGNSWRTINTLSVGRGYLGRAGIMGGALAVGGDNVISLSSTEKYTSAPAFSSITAAAIEVS